VVAILVGIFLITPTVIVVVMSFSTGATLHFPPPGLGLHWYRNFFADQEWRASAVTSIKVGTAAAAIATVLGTLTALGLVRGRYPGKGLITAIVLSPLIVPWIVVAVGMYLVFSSWHLTGTYLGFVVAHASLGIPFVVVNVATALRRLDTNLELAAQNLGAGPLRVFWRVTLPLIVPSIVAGALLAFVTSWDEVIIAIFLSSPLTRTLPVVMWNQVQANQDPTIAAVSTMLTALTVVIVIATTLFIGWQNRLRRAPAAGRAAG